MNDYQETKLKELCRSIVENNYPSQVTAFDIQGTQIINKLNEGDYSSENAKGEFEAGVSPEEIFEFVKVVIATYKIVVEVINWSNSMLEKDDASNISNVGDLSVLKDRYINKLKEEGLKEVEARKIVSEFSEDIYNLYAQND